ncbi:hypothetical protein Mapa_004393 [Marchantia paleacea]|nr:hypothetical protein Mapa_004393 [Marchantia paleacea]
MKGLSVIELGAGLGLTGLLCARLCEHVVITDYNDTILKVYCTMVVSMALC